MVLAMISSSWLVVVATRSSVSTSEESEGVNEVEGEAPGVASGVDIMSCPFFMGSLLSLVPMLE